MENLLRDNGYSDVILCSHHGIIIIKGRGAFPGAVVGEYAIRFHFTKLRLILGARASKRVLSAVGFGPHSYTMSSRLLPVLQSSPSIPAHVHLNRDD